MFNIYLGASHLFEYPQLRILFSALLSIFNRVIWVSGVKFLSSLHILDVSLLSDVGLEKIFPQTVGCHFVLLTVSVQKLCFFIKFHLLILDLRT